MGERNGSNRLYRIWRQMLQRCTNPRCKAFPRYGGAGIAVCAEWQGFDAFEAWSLANGYALDLTIDREDGKAGYSPGNCRWSTPAEQARNTRTNVMVIIDGHEMCLAEAARMAGLRIRTVHQRYHLGWRGADLVRPTSKQRLINRAKFTHFSHTPTA
jgi:hypothetical protein